MPAQRLRATVRWIRGIPVVDLRGDIDAPGEAALEGAYHSAAAGGAGLIVLNFCGVDFINSKGIALIVEFLMRAGRSGQRVLAYGLSDHFRGIFEITRLSDYIGIYQDEASALSAADPAELASLRTGA
jgi:anti-sigma B factor antagonist